MKLAKPDWYSHTIEPPTIEQLTQYCQNHSVEVALEANLKQLWAGYDHEKHVVYISRRAPVGWIAPLLAHETFHIANGHNGHQSPAIERRIDFLVASRFIDYQLYSFWECELGSNPGALADALDLPRNLIEAFQQELPIGPLAGCTTITDEDYHFIANLLS